MDADALSRLKTKTSAIAAMKKPQLEELIDRQRALAQDKAIKISVEQKRDKIIQQIIEFTETDVFPKGQQLRKHLRRHGHKYCTEGNQENGIILYYERKGRRLIVIPKSLRAEVLLAEHDSYLAGHMSWKKTLERILLKYH